MVSFEAEKTKRQVLEVWTCVNEKFCFGCVRFEMPMRHPHGVQISGEIRQGLRFGTHWCTNGIQIP